MQDPNQISNTYAKSKNALFVYFYSLTGDKEKAEDLIQEVFLIFTKDPSKFDPNKGSFYAWGATVGRNFYFGSLRKSGRMKTNDSVLVEILPSGKASPEAEVLENIHQEKMIRSLADCVQSLSEGEKRIVEEKFKNNSTLESIGNLLGVTKRSVSRRYADVLKKLRACLERKGVSL